MINHSQDRAGHLFQGRFGSYPMSDSHLIAAVRYVENDPVKAGLVTLAENWAWSRARSHCSGEPDQLTSLEPVAAHLPNWRAHLRDGAEAAERDEAIDSAIRSGRPLGPKAWLETISRPRAPRGRPKKLGTVPI